MSITSAVSVPVLHTGSFSPLYIQGRRLRYSRNSPVLEQEESRRQDNEVEM